ncbi:MAG TPA: glutamate 5-kinase [Nitrospirota bacterium]|nr:glutamate 5-kinase [Nitrospirota bacterium]
MKNIGINRKVIFSKALRIVIKVGSAVLTSSEEGLDQGRIERLASDISTIMSQGRQVILVSSGAIAAGLAKLGLKKKRAMPLSLKQAAASVGQSSLMWIYEKTFGSHGHKVAQILLTREDLSNRTRFLNARSTLQTLLNYGVVPIVNENDTVSVDEIKFGDNDNLSGMVVHLADADLLVILSDIDGLYTADPKFDPSAELITTVEKITPEIERGAGGAQSQVGTGGMRSKIVTARKVGAYGAPMVIVNGKKSGVLQALFEGKEIGTLFLPKSQKQDSRKHWIAYTVTSSGRLMIDDGGREALVHKGKSLLPGGIVKVEGNFKIGDCVTCVDRTGTAFARGLVKYSAAELELIKGLKTSLISSVLGHKDYDEVIHRDDLVLL